MLPLLIQTKKKIERKKCWKGESGVQPEAAMHEIETRYGVRCVRVCVGANKHERHLAFGIHRYYRQTKSVLYFDCKYIDVNDNKYNYCLVC